MSDSIRAMFDKLPTFWKMSVVRCLIYAVVVGINGIISGLDGYQSFAEISGFTLFKLACAVIVDMLMVWISFLDTSIKDVKPPTQTTTITDTQTTQITVPVARAQVAATTTPDPTPTDPAPDVPPGSLPPPGQITPRGTAT